MTTRRWVLGSSIAAALLTLAVVAPLSGQQFFQYGFESRDPIWMHPIAGADIDFKVLAHKLTDEAAHSGQRSEMIRLQVAEGRGSFIYFTYEPGKAPVGEDLSVSVWVKANRPGISLRCRAVLPKERDSRNLDRPLDTLLQGDTYQLVGRWQQLTLRQPLKRLREQQQLLRAERKTDVNVADAYVDQIILNLYAGPGSMEVYTDDLEVGPLTENRSAQVTPPPPGIGAPGVPATPVSPGSGGGVPFFPAKADEVTLKGSPARLMVGGERFFVRGIRHTGTPLKVLHEAGFNTVWLDESAPVGLIDDAVNLGFWIVPMIRADEVAAGPTADYRPLAANVRRFLERGGVLAWDLGCNMDEDHYSGIARTATLLRSVDPTRPILGDLVDGYRRYTANIDQFMLGIHRWPLGTTLELPAYRDWLRQRKNLGLPGCFCWTWVQSHLPDWFLQQAYDGKPRTDPTTGTEPMGPQAEQLRLLTYLAIASGYKGVGFWSDRFLADSTTGRERLLTLAQLNLEMRLLEPLLLQAEEAAWIDTSSPQVKAAVLKTPKATVVLPMWIGESAQIVPGQSTIPSLKVTVPYTTASQVWEVSPGHIHSLPWDRVPGGYSITLPEFSLTSILVLTSDLTDGGTVVTLQEQVRAMAPWAAQWAYDQAREELDKVEKVQTDLDRMGLPLPDAGALFHKSRQYLDSSLALRRNGDYSEAYLEAQRALRPLRILMRTQWDRCMKEVDTPVATPYLLSFFTLPRHLQFWSDVKSMQATQNVLSDGDFETPPNQTPVGWVVREAQSPDDVVTTARRVANNPKQGKQCLALQVMPKNKEVVPRALERTMISLQSPDVKLPPGSLVRISVWINVPGTIKASPDGALFYDSVGGEPMAVRVTGTGAAGWKKVTVYRRVPASGTVHVVLAMTGLGSAFFDDVRIEPLAPGNQATPPSAYHPVANRGS
jgi:hypothetical protein